MNYTVPKLSIIEINGSNFTYNTESNVIASHTNLSFVFDDIFNKSKKKNNNKE